MRLLRIIVISREDGDTCAVEERAVHSTRDLLRRRLYLVRKHAELESHIRNTRYRYNAPAFEKRIHRTVNREGVSERFDDPMARASPARVSTSVHPVAANVRSCSPSM